MHMNTEVLQEGQRGLGSWHFISNGDNKIFSCSTQNSTQLEQQWLLTWNLGRRRSVWWTMTHKSKVSLLIWPFYLIMASSCSDSGCFITSGLFQWKKPNPTKSVAYPQQQFHNDSHLSCVSIFFSEVRSQLADQLKVLDLQLEQKSQQLQDLTDYLRRRGEIESEYARSLEKLAEKFTSRTKR